MRDSCESGPALPVWCESPWCEALTLTHGKDVRALRHCSDATRVRSHASARPTRSIWALVASMYEPPAPAAAGFLHAAPATAALGCAARPRSTERMASMWLSRRDLSSAPS